eukprot:TRINITY_DN10646_c0_g1_i1.p1 TRINITY_DN10646_c0_g1~~TRINITY_DN10646_c0_g1_i1.p1  ORF type:complete len:424 (+),score=82.64 TRINITY_DN10646_c0_g1_i1:56-1327(+)
MACSALFILDMKGKILMSRNYRGEVPMGVAEKFASRISDSEDDWSSRPVVHHNGVTYFHLKHSNLIFLAVTNRNSNAMTMFSFLYKLIQVLQEYFKELEEESIRDNFVIIYELLDEMMDHGYPQISDTKILQEYITQEGHKLEKEAPIAVTNAVSWRSEGIKYRKNEVFLDVVESINVLANANGTLLRSEINGAVKMRCFLSGMPELRLGLNDKLQFEAHGKSQSRGKAVELEDVKLHQCVRLSRFENDRTISFIPPDGEFELMSYRLTTQVKPLIWVDFHVQNYSTKIEYDIKAVSQFKTKSTANGVEIKIPVPSDAHSPEFQCAVGTVKYVPEEDAFIWYIKQFPGGKSFSMRAQLRLPTIQNAEDRSAKRPIAIKFEIPYFTVSGLQVRYLKIIEKSGYQALPWVRYITQNGGYEIRMNN